MPAFPHGVHGGTVVPLDRRNVDTDAIFPKQYGRSTARSGYGAVLFDSWRYLDAGDLGSDHSRRRLDPAFVLNRPELAGATVLLARENFGCGSSREHAVWALRDYGFRAVIAPSFGDIFRQNCSLNGLAAIVLREREVDALFALGTAQPLRVRIDVLRGQLGVLAGRSGASTGSAPSTGSGRSGASTGSAPSTGSGRSGASTGSARTELDPARATQPLPPPPGEGWGGGAATFGFQLTPREQLLLTQDLDWIGATLAHRDRIAAFESARLLAQPWLARPYPET